ncbi:hypothetical protein [Escherichia coli]|uniref:hypothetical protein n=1 Tax=Escherichia coli TaxID=562 RepID=UPI000DDB91B2|nr:hypothetical protein [Escherichia coli]
MTDLGGKTCIFSHPVYLFLREFSLQDSRGGSLASIACGLKKNIYGHHFGAPHDAADFRRCVALVEQIPEIRDSFNKVAKRVPAFKGILNEWDSLVALLKSEMKIHGNKAPETYRRISELRKD